MNAYARLADDMLFPSREAAMKYLVGIRHPRIAVDLPGHLGAFVEGLPPGHSFTIDDLIDKHTALLFYAPFLPPTRVARLREMMVGGSGHGLHTCAGITASVVPAFPQLRYCPLCIEADRQRVGFGYWRRVHQLPGVHVCPDHAVWLEASNIPIWGRSFRESLVPAERVVERRSPRSLDDANVEHQIHLWVAHGAAFLLAYPQLTSPDAIRHRYIQLLAKRGLATYRGKVRTPLLLQAFQQSYPQRLLAGWGLSIDPENTKNWLARLVRSSDHAQHPICHLLLMRFLDITPEQFFAMPGEEAPFGEPPWPCLNPVCPEYLSLCISACRIDYRPDGRGKPTGIFTCNCGYVYTRTGPDQTPDDRWRKTRIEAYGSVWEETLRLAWADRDKSLPDIVHQFATDAATIKRNAARLGLSFDRDHGTVAPLAGVAPLGPISGTHADQARLADHKVVWLAAIQANPNVGVRALAELLPREHAALYRHDPLWLQGHTPRKQAVFTGAKPGVTMVNWQKRDRVFAKLVRRAAKRMKQQAGRPVRVTRNRLGEMLRLRGFLQNQLHQLPQTAEALSEVVESAQEFTIRRIRYIAEQARHAELILTRAKLLDWANAWPYKDDLDVQQAIAAALAVMDAGQVSSDNEPYKDDQLEEQPT